MKLRDLAERLHCRFDAVAGDIEIVRVAGIEQAQPGDLTFVANPRYQALVSRTRASAIILGLAPGDPAVAVRVAAAADSSGRPTTWAVNWPGGSGRTTTSC